MSKKASLIFRFRYLTSTVLCLFAAFSPSLFGADAVLQRLPAALLVPGGAAVVPTASDAIRGEYKGERVLLARFEGEQYAIIGIPLSAKPGLQTFTLDNRAGETETLGFSIADKTYTEQRLTIKTNAR